MIYIKDSKVILTPDEMNHVSGYDFEEESDIWLESNNVELEYDTLFKKDYNGDPEHGRIYGKCIIKHDNKLWKCEYCYTNMSGHGNMSKGDDFIFTPVEAKTKTVVDYV